eukprot:SAG31_NODE_39627_length_286_cov_8.941176_1_plen_38_part_01
MGAMWLCGRVACASNVSKISAPTRQESGAQKRERLGQT